MLAVWRLGPPQKDLAGLNVPHLDSNGNERVHYSVSSYTTHTGFSLLLHSLPRILMSGHYNLKGVSAFAVEPDSVRGCY